MPFVKKTRMASSGPLLEGRCLPTGSPQDQHSKPGEGRGDCQLSLSRLSFMNTLHQAERRTGD